MQVLLLARHLFPVAVGRSVLVSDGLLEVAACGFVQRELMRGARHTFLP